MDSDLPELTSSRWRALSKAFRRATVLLNLGWALRVGSAIWLTLNVNAPPERFSRILISVTAAIAIVALTALLIGRELDRLMTRLKA